MLCFCTHVALMPLYINIKQHLNIYNLQYNIVLMAFLYMLIDLFVILIIRPNTLSESTYQSCFSGFFWGFF